MIMRVAVAAVTGLALVPLGVLPQLSARLTGEEYRLRVAPVDPIDPFRGAYVDLEYPDLRSGPDDSRPPSMEDGRQGPVYISLRRDGDVWVRDSASRERPTEGPYLACDDSDWAIRCGIESWFASQSDAASMEDEVARDGAIAVVRIDSRGNAALVGLEVE